MIALKAINFHVPAHMITAGDFQSDWRKCNPIKKAQRSTGTVKSTAPCQRFFSRLRRSWLRPTAEDVSAFGQHRKFPPHARKTYGTQGSTTIETCWIESINLGHNARFFATLTKIGKYIKFNNEAEKHTWSRNKNQMDASLWEGNLLQYGFTCFKMADVISSLALPNRTMGTWRVYTE